MSTKAKVISLIVLLLLIFFIAGATYILKAYTVEEVSVTGNQHYTVDQIKDIVMSDRFGHNSLYLNLKYRNRPVLNVPFVETMDVDILSPTSVSITVYEKAIAGYVEYLDRYMYFDKDGIVVESSKIKQNDVPYVAGLEFDHVVMYEALPVGDETVFKSILDITQLLSKYHIRTDQIYFDNDNDVSLYFGDSRVVLGTLENIDEKMMMLPGIIPNLTGLKGTLYLDNYSEEEDNEYITFQRDDVKQHTSILDETVSNDTISDDSLSEKSASSNFSQ